MTQPEYTKPEENQQTPMYATPSPPDPLAHCPNPTHTISLSIPFILIGSKSVPDDIYHWTDPLKPLHVVHHMLSTQNPSIPLHLSKPLTPTSANKSPTHPPQLPDPKNNNTWTLRTDTEILLTEKEKQLPPPGAWSLGITLTTPQSTYQNSHWRRELHALLATLQTDFNNPHPSFPFRLLCNETCNLRLSVGPGQEWCEVVGGWSGESLERVVLGLVGFERVMVGVMKGRSTLRNLVRFKSFGRGFRQRGRRIGRRRDRAKYLRGCGSGNEMGRDGEAEREAEIDDVLGWCGGISHAASSASSFGALLEEMRSEEGEMAVRFPTRDPLPFPPGASPSSSRPLSLSSDSCHLGSSMSEIAALASEIVFASHPSSLEAGQLEAYVDLMTLFIDFCYWTPKQVTWEKMWELNRLHEFGSQGGKAEAIGEFLNMVGLDSRARSYWVEKTIALRSKSEVHGGDDRERMHGEEDVEMYRPSWWELKREFGELGAVVKRVEERKRRDERLKGVFLRRYELAGGFGGRDRRWSDESEDW